MKLKNASISFLPNSDRTTIEIHDNDASIKFATITLTNDQLASMLSRLSKTPCSVDVVGLEKVGKKMKHKKIEFEVPENISYGPDRQGVLESLCAEAMTEQGLTGWHSQNYYNSQDSFFNRGEKRYAQTTIQIWE